MDAGGPKDDLREGGVQQLVSPDEVLRFVALAVFLPIATSQKCIERMLQVLTSARESSGGREESKSTFVPLTPLLASTRDGFPALWLTRHPPVSFHIGGRRLTDQ